MNQRVKCIAVIKTEIEKMNPGEAFTANDFAEIAGVDAVNKALSRLSAQGEIRRIIQGVYDKPEYSVLLNESSAPRIDKIAAAIARKYNWTIAPSKDAALNMFHISTQVPNVWEYISDGPYRQYEIGTTTLCFKKRANKDTSGRSYLTIAVAEALKAVGQERINEDVLERIRMAIPLDERSQICSESNSMTGWVRENIKKICEE